jgi:poly(3-hydroxybutyrate) depolymerase
VSRLNRCHAAAAALSLALLACKSPGPSPMEDLGTSSGPIDLAGFVLPSLPGKTGDGTFAIPGRQESAIKVVLPDPLPARPPLIISFHGTGDGPTGGLSDFRLVENGPAHGVVVIAPRAGYRNGVYPGDVDHEPNASGSSWNMWNTNVDTNEDLRYVQALIAAAQATYDADPSRVYVMGFSNGAFFAYFVAASLPSQIAGFAEASGGWTTDKCPTRYGSHSAGLGFYPTSGPPAGESVSCASLYASTNPPFPTQCIPSATNPLRPPVPGARVPFGYLAHYSSDSTVSVAWTCYLESALGGRAQATIRYRDAVTIGHNAPPDFFDRAWAFFAGRTNTQ